MPQIINVDELPNTNSPIPTQICRVVVTAVDQKPSSKGNCMDTFKLEILDPEYSFNGDVKVAVAGREATMRITYSTKMLKMLKGELHKIGVRLTEEEWKTLPVPTTDEVQRGSYTRIPAIQDLTKTLERQSFLALVKAEPYYKTDTGKWDGKPVLDEQNQKIVAGYRHNVELADVQGEV